MKSMSVKMASGSIVLLRTRVCAFLAGLAALSLSCEKNPDLADPGRDDSTVVTYTREGVTPVTLQAGHETRTVLQTNSVLWNKGDAIALLKSGENSLQLLNARMISQMAEGDKKSILLVNPSKSGCFLGYDGTNRVRNSTGLGDLSGGSISPDVAESNLNKITGLAENLRNDSDYIFVLEKVDEGFLLYHKASGIGLTSEVGSKDTENRYPCVWGNNLAAVAVLDGSENLGSTNTVTGRPEQRWIKKIGGTAAGHFLWSGGNGSESLRWHPSTNGWTNWLFYEIPDNSYPFTADSAGASVTFTNTTGFSAGNDTWYAVYPASAGPSASNGQLTFSLPARQTYRADSFGNGANVSVGVLKNDHLSFRSVCGVLRLSLTGTQRVLSISVKDKAGASLWGTATVPVSEIVSGVAAQVSGGSDTVTLDCAEGVMLQSDVATDFYIVVPAGAFSNGFDVEITTPYGIATKSTTQANTISRAVIKQMPAFSIHDEDLTLREVNIQNEVVSAYMAKGSYSSFGESSYFSLPDVEALANACKWSADQPAGMTVSWSETGGALPTITVTENEQVWYTEGNLSGNSYTITNLTPGCTYTYRVEADGTMLAEGRFKAVGPVRMVHITDTWNYRDLGGWTGLDGKTIRYGKIFRGGSLNGVFNGEEMDHQNADYNNFTFHGQTDIDRLGIKAELDLRGDPTYVVGMWGSEQYAHSVSLLQPKFYAAGTQKFADFQRIMSDYGLFYPTKRSSLIQDVAWIIQELKDGKPVAFHCRSGADRTGALSFLIEGLLGVSEGDIACDYELTSLSSESINKRLASSAISGSYGFFKKTGGKFFWTDFQGNNLQEKCYYYLNQYFDDVRINASDLDWFIKEMLGLESYTHPTWAEDYNGNKLETVAGIRTGSGSITYPN